MSIAIFLLLLWRYYNRDKIKATEQATEAKALSQRKELVLRGNAILSQRYLFEVGKVTGEVSEMFFVVCLASNKG